jgi:hypothetical protein
MRIVASSIIFKGGGGFLDYTLRVTIRRSLIPLIAAILAACNPATDGTLTSGGSTASPTPTAAPGPSRNVRVTWTANREKAVNMAGGGYRVYYSVNNNFLISAASSIDVPYTAGPTAPTAVTIPSLTSGTWYIKVVGYSATNSTGTVSSQAVVNVP